MKIGKKLKNLRLMKNESTKAIANYLSMSESNYGKIERDELDISIDNVQKLANFYQLKVDEILNNDNLTVNVTNQNGGKSWTGINNTFNDFNTLDAMHNQISDLKERIKFLENEILEKNKVIESLLRKLG
jgi:transcriptional regulator with XRE-family HTH domain